MDWRERAEKMHRRAQAAEAERDRMRTAYAEALEYSFQPHMVAKDRGKYAHMLFGVILKRHPAFRLPSPPSDRSESNG